MDKIYQGRSGKTYTINEPALASGGEGSVYAIDGIPNLVMKIFKEDKRTLAREEKLLKMVQYQLTTRRLSQIAWPQDVVYDQGCFIGYVMPRLWDNRNLNVVYSTQNNRLDLRYRVLIAYNLCAAVDTVHSLNQVCGDLNPQNICVNLNLESKSALRVTLVDTDSYHITDGDKIHRCEVGLANYLAPEIQKKMAKGYDLKSAELPTYTKETDLFALAVHIFALLMNGCHPFACAKQTDNGYENTMEAMDDTEQESVVLPQPIENIRDGFFPFFQKRSGVTYPLYAPAFEFLPIQIQTLFVRAFVDGYENPNNRPTTQEWLNVLNEYQQDYRYMSCSRKHFYFNNVASVCPLCEANARMMNMLNRRKTEIPSKTGKYSTTQMGCSNLSSTPSNYGKQQNIVQSQSSANNTSSGVKGSRSVAFDIKVNLAKLQTLKLVTLFQLIFLCVAGGLWQFGWTANMMETDATYVYYACIVATAILIEIVAVAEIVKWVAGRNIYRVSNRTILSFDIINSCLAGVALSLFLAIMDCILLGFAITDFTFKIGFFLDWTMIVGVAFAVIAICVVVIIHSKQKELQKVNQWSPYINILSYIMLSSAILVIMVGVLVLGLFAILIIVQAG